MPIYEHDCMEHGLFEVFTRVVDPLPKRPCETCGEPAAIAVSRLGRFNVERGWNEKANEYQRDPYTQAKAQLENVRRETLERVGRDCDRPTGPITEEAIQVGAKAIAEQAKKPEADPQAQQINEIRKARKAKANAV